LNFHNLRVFIQAAAAITSTSSGNRLLNNVFRLIVMEASSATFITRGSLNWSIPLDFCPRLVYLASHGSESVSAAARFCWELRGLEWKHTGIKALSLELLLCWELTGPDVTVVKGFSTDGDGEEVTDLRLVVAFGKVCVRGF
jgi:hypothetical protein